MTDNHITDWNDITESSDCLDFQINWGKSLMNGTHEYMWPLETARLAADLADAAEYGKFGESENAADYTSLVLEMSNSHGVSPMVAFHCLVELAFSGHVDLEQDGTFTLTIPDEICDDCLHARGAGLSVVADDEHPA